jgi:hypothetical protein
MALKEGTAKSIMAAGLKVADGMDAKDKVLLRQLEEKIHRRLGREIAPTSLRYKQEDNSSD